MDHEPYRTISHHEAADMIASELRRLDWQTAREFVLPDGTIADVFARTSDADFAIIEVKSEVKSSHLDMAWLKYARWSNLLWVAFTEPLLTELAGLQHSPGWPHPRDKVGLVGVYREGLIGYRSPHQRGLRGDLYEQLRDLLALR